MRKRPFVSMGTVLLLTAVLTVLLVSFSLLSLSAARSDLERSRALARQRQEYYQACNAAREQARDLRQGIGPVPEPDHRGLVQLLLPMGEDRQLLVTLDPESLQILRWQTLPPE